MLDAARALPALAGIDHRVLFSTRCFKQTGALLEGHFILSSGLRSPRYLQCARVLMNPARAARLAEALAADAPILLPMRAEAAGEPRVTLTAPVLQAAEAIHILITGAEKRAAIELARDLPPEQAPISAVLDNATVHWAE